MPEHQNKTMKVMIRHMFLIRRIKKFFKKIKKEHFPEITILGEHQNTHRAGAMRNRAIKCLMSPLQGQTK